MSSTLAFSLKNIRERRVGVEHVQLPPHVIGVLTQVRREVGEIDDLATSIKERGQLAPGVAVALTPRQAGVYVRTINEIWGTEHVLREIPRIRIDGVLYYTILVAGHRRHSAVSYIVANGYRPTKYFDGLFRVDLHFNLKAVDALSIQFQENRYTPVPLHEEAAAAWKYYRFCRRQNPQMTLSGFGRKLARSSAWVRSALRFCALPESLQELASSEELQVPYGILVEIARYAETMEQLGKPIEEMELLRMVVDAVLKCTTVERFRQIVSSKLEHHQQNGQHQLFGDLPEQRKPYRRVVAPELVRGIWALLAYLKQVRAIFGDASFLGPELQPDVLAEYSPGSPLRLSVQLTGYLEELLPQLVELAAREGGRHRRALTHGAEVVELARPLLQLLEEEEEKAAAG